MSGLFEHEADEGDDVQIGERLRQSLVVAHEAAEAGGPGEGALGHPAPGREHEAALGLGRLDHRQLGPVLVGGLGRPLARVWP